MRVTILQTDIQWKDAEANRRNAELMIAQCPGSDLYVLPEMWTTGFVTEPSDIAEDEAQSLSDGTLAWMKQTASRHNAALCGSMAVAADGGKYANRAYFVCPDGQVSSYDKRHLFTPGGENREYRPGGKRCVAEFRGVRFLLQVCYDLRFPVWSRNRGDYDAAIYVANWPSARHDAWTTLLQARAIENQCYAIGVNRTGRDKSCVYRGGSITVNPYGKVVARCEDNQQGCATAEIDLGLLEKFREAFPVIGDGDRFSIDN